MFEPAVSFGWGQKLPCRPGGRRSRASRGCEVCQLFKRLGMKFKARAAHFAVTPICVWIVKGCVIWPHLGPPPIAEPDILVSLCGSWHCRDTEQSLGGKGFFLCHYSDLSGSLWSQEEVLEEMCDSAWLGPGHQPEGSSLAWEVRLVPWSYWVP